MSIESWVSQATIATEVCTNSPQVVIYEKHIDVFMIFFGKLAVEGAFKLIFDQGVGGAWNIYFARCSVRFHPRGHIYRISPDVIGKFLDAYNARYHRSGMNSDTGLEIWLFF